MVTASFGLLPPRLGRERRPAGPAARAPVGRHGARAWTARQGGARPGPADPVAVRIIAIAGARADSLTRDRHAAQQQVVGAAVGTVIVAGELLVVRQRTAGSRSMWSARDAARFGSQQPHRGARLDIAAGA